MAMENLGGLGFGCGFLNFLEFWVRGDCVMSPVVGLVFSPHYYRYRGLSNQPCKDNLFFFSFFEPGIFISIKF